MHGSRSIHAFSVLVLLVIPFFIDYCPLNLNVENRTIKSLPSPGKTDTHSSRRAPKTIRKAQSTILYPYIEMSRKTLYCNYPGSFCNFAVKMLTSRHVQGTTVYCNSIIRVIQQSLREDNTRNTVTLTIENFTP